MAKYITAVALFTMIGLGICGFAATKAQAYMCTTTCNTIGGYTYCNQYCF